MQSNVILKEPPPWVSPLSLSGGARVKGAGGAAPPSYAPDSSWFPFQNLRQIGKGVSGYGWTYKKKLRITT